MEGFKSRLCLRFLQGEEGGGVRIRTEDFFYREGGRKSSLLEHERGGFSKVVFA